jgi:hypothetical protein
MKNYYYEMSYEELRNLLLEISGKLKNQEGTEEELSEMYDEQIDIMFELEARYNKVSWKIPHLK